MSEYQEIEVESYVNTHSHIREDNRKQKIVGPLLRHVIEGGADTVLTITNTKNGVTTAKDALRYWQYAQSHIPRGQDVTIIPTMMANEETELDEVDQCADLGIFDIKFIPLKRTTHSHYGVRHYGRIIPLLQRCGKRKVRSHFHPEHPWMKFISRDAEYQFLALMDIFLNETEAELFWEHGTDGRCIPFWKEMAKSGRFFVGLTGHHLATNDDDTFGDVRATCKPPIKTEPDRLSLIDLVTENHPWVIYGPDDAPHPLNAKHVHEKKCACGATTSRIQLQLAAHALSHLLISPRGKKTFINFTSRNARRIFNLKPATRKITLVKKPHVIPIHYKAGTWTLESFWAGQTLDYSIKV